MKLRREPTHGLAHGPQNTGRRACLLVVLLTACASISSPVEGQSRNAPRDLRENYRELFDLLLPGGEPVRFQDVRDEVHPPPRTTADIERLGRFLFDRDWYQGRHAQPKTWRFPGRAEYGGCAEIGDSRLFAALRKLDRDSAAQMDSKLSRLLKDRVHLAPPGRRGAPGGPRERATGPSAGEGLPPLPRGKPASETWQANPEQCDPPVDQAETVEPTRFRLIPNDSSDAVKKQVKTSLGRAYCELCARAGFDCPPAVTVHILDMFEGLWGSASSEGPIRLSRSKLMSLMDSNPDAGIQSLVTHEFFHKIEYQYGFRREWLGRDGRDVGWLAEGLAAWAETYVHRALNPQSELRNSGTKFFRRSPLQEIPLRGFWKQEPILSKPSLKLWERDYDALPVWLSLEPAGIRGSSPIFSQADPAVQVKELLSSIRDSGLPKASFESEWEPESFRVYAERLAVVASSSEAKYHFARSLLDESRGYLRPYNVRVGGSPKWQWKHNGRVEGMAARIYRFLAEDGVTLDGLVVKVKDQTSGALRDCEARSSAGGGSVFCAKVHYPSSGTPPLGNGVARPRIVTLVVVGSRPAGDPYTVVATRRGSQ